MKNVSPNGETPEESNQRTGKNPLIERYYRPR